MTTDHMIGPAALAADDLLTHPDAGHLAAILRTLMPTALMEQLDAAADQIQQGMRRTADLGLVEHGYLPAAQHPDWIRLGALSALAGWHLGRADTCMHSPHPDRPQPLAAAAFKPGLVVCGKCTHLLRVAGRADRTCDGCGCLGTANDDPIWPGLIAVGVLAYTFGVCRSCKYWPDDQSITKRSLRKETS